MSQQKTAQAGRQAANQAREQRAASRSQASAQAAAADVRANMAGISPTAASSAGPALDPTKGYSFVPGARPADLPMPGSAPGGVEQQKGGPDIFTGGTMGDEMSGAAQAAMDGLPDDHDDLVGSHGPTPPQQPPRTPRQQTVKKGPVKIEHPILAKLRHDLGIQALPVFDVEIGGHIWTLRTLSPSDVAMAASMATTMAQTIVDQKLLSETAIVAHAVAAIDGVPAYEIFGIDPPVGVIVTDHLRPPRQILYQTVVRVFEFINEGTRTFLPQKLHAAYRDKCEAGGAVESYLDNAEGRRVHFRCIADGCGHELIFVPRIVPGTNDMLIPFCQWHGEPMELLGVQPELNRPLA